MKKRLIVSDHAVLRYLDRERFEPVPVSIDKQGRWQCHDLRRIEGANTESLPIPADSPFIRLEAGLRKDYLVVTETNPAPADDTRKKRRIPHLERGIGLHILTDLAGRYHGSCTQEVRDGQFTVSIALQLPENQGETEEA